MANKALILVDIQKDYFPGGSMELVEMEAAASQCKQILNAFRNNNAPIFHIQHIAKRAGATFFVENTEGVEIHESVFPSENETKIIKHFPNSFLDTTLEELLKHAEIEEVVICGAMTHMCIDSTTRAAFDLGFTCNVISDACATRDLALKGDIVKAGDVQAAFMAALSVPFANILSTEEYLSL